MARGLAALASALIVIGFVWHMALTAACTGATPTVDAGVCQPEAGSCTSNRDCARAPCDAGPEGGTCQAHCTVGGLDSTGYAMFCCAIGQPGPGDAGAPCSGPDDCATGVCAYEADFMTGACSPYCNADTDCPSVLPKCLLLDAGLARVCGLPP
jgi:hypothetical protein